MLAMLWSSIAMIAIRSDGVLVAERTPTSYALRSRLWIRSPPDAISKTTATTNPRNQSDFQNVKFFIPVPSFYIFILMGYSWRLNYFTVFADKYMIFFISALEIPQNHKIRRQKTTTFC